MKITIFITTIITTFIFFSCTTIKNIPENTFTQQSSIQEIAQEPIEDLQEIEEEVIEPQEEMPVLPQTQKSQILLTFAGDVMAHSENFEMKAPFSDIWTDIEYLMKDADFAFANMEAPVDDSRAWEAYPTFNMKTIYPETSIKAGFNVFSLANNHTNDQGIGGMKSTYNFFTQQHEETKNSKKVVYSAGLKPFADAPLTYQLIEYGDWKILFVAITEVLNSLRNSSYIDYIPSEPQARIKFIDELVKLRQENPCDLFIVSIHCNEPEYVRTVKEKQKDFYYTLLDNGIDVVWANHPHVARNWEVLGSETDKIPQQMIMYSLGNTISGQRRDPQFNAPETARDYTGDGYIIQVRFEKEKKDDESFSKPQITWVNPVLITTYIENNGDYIIKRLNDKFLDDLKKSGNNKWANYLEERRNLMENTKGKLIWR